MGDEGSQMVAREPERLGSFELIKRIGTGGFCETYLARQHGPDGFVKDVCLKRVLPERAGDPEYVAPMRDEAVPTSEQPRAAQAGSEIAGLQPQPGDASQAGLSTAVIETPASESLPPAQRHSPVVNRAKSRRWMVASFVLGGLLAAALYLGVDMPGNEASKALAGRPARSPTPALDAPTSASASRMLASSIAPAETPEPSMPAPSVDAATLESEPTDLPGTTADRPPKQILCAPTPAPGSKRASSSSAAKTAKLVVHVDDTNTWEVWVDAVYMGQTPATVAVAPGRHEVAIGKEQPSLRKTIRVAGQRTKNVRFTPSAP